MVSLCRAHAALTQMRAALAHAYDPVVDTFRAPVMTVFACALHAGAGALDVGRDALGTFLTVHSGAGCQRSDRDGGKGKR